MAHNRNHADSDNAESWPDWQRRSACLQDLANGLRPFALLVRHGGPVPELRISDPRDSRHSERVVVSADSSGAWWFRWAHGERIAPVDQPEQAARMVARVVHAVSG